MIKKFHSLYIILILLFCVSCIQEDSLFTRSNQKSAPLKQVKITLILPLTGQNANTGKNLLDASLMALSDLKIPNIQVSTIDSAHPHEQIIAKLDKLQTDFIIGPVYAHDVKGLIPYAKEKGLCMLTFSNDVSISSNGCTLLLGVMPEQSVEKIIKYTKSKGYNHIFAVLPNNKYGDAIAKHIKEPETTIAGFYDSNDDSIAKTDIEKAIKTIKSKTSDHTTTAILLPDNREAANIAYQLSSKSLNKYKFIGGGLWEDESIYPSLNNGWFAAPSKRLRLEFENHFRSKYGYKPQKIATLGYDAICLAAALLANNATNKIALDLFTKNEGFKGLTSSFKFMPNGVNLRSLSIYEIKDGHATEIEAANDLF